MDAIALEGTHVRLEAPDDEHIPDLLIAGQDPGIWEFMPFGPFTTTEEWRAAFARWAEQAAAGKSVSFVIVDKSNGRAVGMTAYLDLHSNDRWLEIGGTWLAPVARRTAINTECKYLLLRHAFEKMGCVRVQLKTDARNVRSQRAIERLGAVKEGVLRKHMRTRGGYQRDTVMYSIVDGEWPAVKHRLEEFLGSSKQSTVKQ